MPDPIAFASTTPRHGLPNLFAAQAQKEFTVNEAFALIDALLHAVVEGEANDPPSAARNGECWIIGATPTGDWSARPGQLACRQAGNWLFTAPVDGMTVYDRSAGCIAHFMNEWASAAAVSLPAGGGTVDSEARTALSDLVASLQSVGVLPQS
jgi:hypothetical protein